MEGSFRPRLPPAATLFNLEESSSPCTFFTRIPETTRSEARAMTKPAIAPEIRRCVSVID